jgi:hypothetical protein
VNAIYDFLARKEQDAGFFCPACTSHGLDAEDMDLHNFWHHSQAMRDRYKAACCKDCTDRHLVTEDGVCMPRDKAMRDASGDYWADESALWEAEEEAAADDADRRMYSEWRL